MQGTGTGRPMPEVRNTKSSTDHTPVPELSKAEQERFHAKVRRTDGCWEWGGERNPRGYGRFVLFRRGRLRIQAHRVAYLLATGRDPGDLIIRHTCDNPPCCRPDHLLVGTTLQNANDAWMRGRRGRGPLGQHTGEVAAR